MAPRIDILPEEVLHNVFSNLSVSDKLKASIVCKKWFEVLSCKSLLADMTIVIDNKNDVPVFTFASRNFLNFTFKEVVIDNSYYELFERFSSYIEYISFENCRVIRKEKLSFEDLRFDNLKTLKSIDCDLWTLFPGLPNLKELYLTGNSTITDAGLAILQKSMKHLEVFSLLCCISSDQRVFSRFYPQNMTYETHPSPLVLSFRAVLSFVSERATTLREIHLDYDVPPIALKELTSIRGLCLYKINFHSTNLSAESLIDLFHSQPKLKAIKLSSMLEVDENVINALCSLLSDIEEISLQFRNIKTPSLSKLFQLSKLKKLDISGILNMSANAFNEAILNLKAYRLEFLNLSHILYDAGNMLLDVLFQQCKYLVHLDISNNKIPDCYIHSISKNLVRLEYLCLKCCGISDYGLTGQRKECFEDTYVTSKKDHLSLSNLKNLKELNLNDCNKITDDAILDTVKFRYLKVLHVNGCYFQLSTIQRLFEQNPSIIDIFWDSGDANAIRMKF